MSYNNRDDLPQHHAPTSHFFENFNIFGGLYITQSNIYDEAFIAKIVSR